MVKKSFKKLIFGFVLIVAAGFIFLIGFYQLQVKPELASRSKINSEKLNATKQKIDQRAAELKQAQMQDEGSVNLSALIKEAEAVYGPQEKVRKEGVLWVDRESANFVVTLGALNGILPGSKLNVYQGTEKVGQVIVDTSYDVISYVHPESSLDLSAEDYYRVAVE